MDSDWTANVDREHFKFLEYVVPYLCRRLDDCFIAPLEHGVFLAHDPLWLAYHAYIACHGLFLPRGYVCLFISLFANVTCCLLFFI